MLRPLALALLFSLSIACDSKAPPLGEPAGGASGSEPTVALSPTAPTDPALAGLLSESREVVKRLYPAANRSGQPITIRYRAHVFDPPETVPPVTRAEWTRRTPLDAFRGWLPAFLSGDVEWIVSVFAPAEQAEVRKRAEDPEQLHRNVQFFRQVEEIRVRQIVLWGNYAIIEFEHRLAGDVSLARPATFIEIDGDWYLTNEAAKNPFFSEVMSVLERKGEEIERVK